VLTPDRIDAVLDVLSQLDSSTVLTVLPGKRGSVHIGVRVLPPDPRCAGAGLFGMDLSDGCQLAAVSFSGSCSAPPDGPGGTDVRVDGSGGHHESGDHDWPGGREWPGGHDVRVDALVTATGEIHSQVHHPEGPAPVSGRAGGVVVDALHRVLGIPVPGQAPPLLDLVTGMWFHEVMRLIDSGSGLGWADVAAAHLQPDSRSTPSLPPASEEVVAASIRRLADDACWERLRMAAVVGRLAAPELDAHEAEWMDATMFGRWMVDSFPSFDALSRRLHDVGAPDAALRIAGVLSRLTRP